MSWGLSVLGRQGDTGEQEESHQMFFKIQVAKEVLGEKERSRINELGGEGDKEQPHHRARGSCMCVSPPETSGSRPTGGVSVWSYSGVRGLRVPFHVLPD